MISELTKQDVIALTNESKRKAILADWQDWGIWHKAPEIGLSVYRLDLPDGSFFTASWYAGDDFFPGGGSMVNRMRYGGTHADDAPPRTGAVYCQFCGQPLKVIGQKRFCNNTRCLNRYNDV